VSGRGREWLRLKNKIEKIRKKFFVKFNFKIFFLKKNRGAEFFAENYFLKLKKFEKNFNFVKIFCSKKNKITKKNGKKLRKKN